MNAHGSILWTLHADQPGEWPVFQIWYRVEGAEDGRDDPDILVKAELLDAGDCDPARAAAEMQAELEGGPVYRDVAEECWKDWKRVCAEYRYE